MNAAEASRSSLTDPDDVLVPVPTSGRTYTGRRRARLADVSPNSRLRLDALARFVQDVSNDDTVDAGLDDDMAWVVRRTVVEVHSEAHLREELALTTFCGGMGSRWAERRVSVTGEDGAHLEAGTLWVHLDAKSGRPKRLPAQFHELYDEAAGGRVVRARLHHEDPPPAGSIVEITPWALRFTDFDLWGHVNNAVSWAAVEETRSMRRHLTAPLRAEVEYRTPIERHDQVTRVVVDEPSGGFSMWLIDAGDQSKVYSTARLFPIDA